uniref:Uncharacterized protein n=1 Tax=Zea mays TaxID=4577 RepID=C0HII6_MAIZE|nr:unknown [Zea mays]
MIHNYTAVTRSVINISTDGHKTIKHHNRNFGLRKFVETCSSKRYTVVRDTVLLFNINPTSHSSQVNYPLVLVLVLLTPCCKNLKRYCSTSDLSTPPSPEGSFLVLFVTFPLFCSA